VKIVTEGTSRIVFVFDDFVVKFPWLPVFRLIKIMLRENKSGTLNQRIKQKWTHPAIVCYLLMVFYILMSNRREYLFYKRYKKQSFLMPTKGFLFGHIIIQPRGEVLSWRMRCWQETYKKIIRLEIKNKDCEKPENFSLVKNKVVIHDYGNIDTQNFLISTKFLTPE